MNLTRVIFGTLLLFCNSLVPFANAQQTATDQARLVLRPHCEAPAEACASYEVENPETLRTPVLNPGDTLDMDIVLLNPGKKAIRRVRAWLSYDAEALEGVSITNGEPLSVPFPGETNFDSQQGAAKISVAAPEGEEPTDETIVIARVKFAARTTPAGGKTPISFHEQSEDTQGHTFAVTADDPERSILASPLGSLLVAVSGTRPAGEQPSPGDASIGTSSASSEASSQESNNSVTTQPFSLLQVQNLRITSENDNIYVAWNPLQTKRLQGYNIYYGTEMGRYVHRRSLPEDAKSMIIRDLPKGTVYYVAIRAVSDTNEESAFSQEVGVEVGNPRSATAPLLSIPGGGAPLTGDVSPQNPVDRPGRAPLTPIPGEAGFATGVSLFFVISAVIGTIFAFRRQFIARSSLSHG